MSADFEWPTPPHFDMTLRLASGEPEPAAIVMTDGRRLSGGLIRFDALGLAVDFQSERAPSNLNIGFSTFKRLCLTQPIDLKRHRLPAAPGSVEVPKSDKEKCTVRFKDGDELFAETVGFVQREYGLFLFLINSSHAVMRWFIPSDAIASYEIGDRLGQMLVDEKILSAAVVEAGLERQHELRTQKLGDYLTQQEIVTPEEMQAALQLQKTRPQLRLGEALLQEKLITEVQLQEALDKQAQNRKIPLGEILVQMGVVGKEHIRRMLSQKLGIPSVNLRKFQVDPNAVKAIPNSLALKHTAMPLYRTETRIAVAMENPLAWEVLQDLEFYSQLKVDPVLASKEDLELAIEQFYGLPAPRGDNLSDLLSELGSDQPTSDSASEEAVTESDNTLVRLVNKIILDAYDKGVSDIHIESVGGNKPSKVRFRKDGVMMPYSEIPRNFRAAVISRVKIMSSLDISEKRRSQDGKINFEQFGPARIELRVVTMPTADGLEDIVMRILAKPKAIPIEGIGLAPRVLESLKAQSVKPQGLVFVCGPTGSGKTTTLHSLLGFINTPDRKIWTAEDPVEITQEGLRQVQVNAKIGWTFANVLRSFLRCDPDVIMVGETRDVETAKTVIEASLTGHLVLSTMHTNGAAESVVRLLDFGLDPFNFADALLAVIGQRLARKLCTNCRQARAPTDEEIEILALQYCFDNELNAAGMLDVWRKQYGDKSGKLTLYSARGCPQCDQTGYKGRIGVYELLVASNAIRKKIYTRATVPEILKVGLAEGMQTMKQDGIEKVLQGHTDLEQVHAVCP